MDCSTSLNEGIKDFFLYDHIKVAKTKTITLCNQHKGSSKNSYCFTCKLSLCETCKENHLNHIIKDKLNYNLEENHIEKVFTELEEDFKHTYNLCANPNSLKEKLKENVNNHFKILTEMVENLKLEKLQYIDNLFDSMDSFLKVVGNQINNSKQSLSTFIDSYKEFILKDKIQAHDVIFLQIFDILNEGYNCKNEIKMSLAKVLKVKAESEDYV